jgi:DNA-binding PadR family transcriptional regulator
MIGSYEEIVLLIVYADKLLDKGLHLTASNIRKELERAGCKASPGAVQVTLNRLVAKKYLSYMVLEPRAVRGGRATRLYSITKDGCDALDRQDRLRRIVSD